MKNALASFVDSFAHAAAPEAYEAGRQRGQQRRLDNALNVAGTALGNRDYDGAASELFRVGELEGGLSLQGYGDDMRAAQAEAQREADEQFYRTALTFNEEMMGKPLAERQAFAEHAWVPLGFDQRMGSFKDMLAKEGPTAFTDIEIDKDITNLRALLGVGRAEGKVINDQLVNPHSGEIIGDYSDPQDQYRTLSQAEAESLNLPLEQGYQVNTATNQISPIRGPRTGSLVTINGDQQPDFEVGSIPPGFGLDRSFSPPRLVPLEGGEPARDTRSGEENKLFASQILNQMANEYLALDRMGAAVNKDASASRNITARFRASDAGRFWEAALGTDAESARQRIEALRPQIVQAIMAQPEISARAFDSDRELQFFLNSVTDVGNDLYANMVALQALDRKFGTGNLISSLPDDVQDAINRDAELALVNAEYDLREAKAQGVLSPTDDRLEGFRLPNGEYVEEQDIQFTMEKHGMTRQQVIDELRTR